jgi:hypothetical protein
MVAFEFTEDKDFNLQKLRAWIRCRQSEPRPRTWKLALTFPFLALLIPGVILRSNLLMFPIWSVLVKLGFAPRLDQFKTLMKRGTGNSSDASDHYRIEISDFGLRATRPTIHLPVSWDTYDSARRLSDGILLFRSADRFDWLPFSSLTAGSPEVAEEIIRRNVFDYHSVRSRH